VTVSYTPTPALLLLFIFEGVLHVSISYGVVAFLLYLPPPLVLLRIVSSLLMLVRCFWPLIILLDGVVPILHIWWSLSGCIYCSSYVSLLLFPSFILFFPLFLVLWPLCPMRTLCILSVGVSQLALPLGHFFGKKKSKLFHCVNFCEKHGILTSSHLLCLNVSLCISISTCSTLAPKIIIVNRILSLSPMIA